MKIEMKKIVPKTCKNINVFTLTAMLLLITINTQAEWEWVNEWTNNSTLIAHEIEIDQFDNTYTTTSFADEIEIDGEILHASGVFDRLLVKRSADNEVLWWIQFSDNDSEIGSFGSPIRITYDVNKSALYAGASFVGNGISIKSSKGSFDYLPKTVPVIVGGFVCRISNEGDIEWVTEMHIEEGDFHVRDIAVNGQTIAVVSNLPDASFKVHDLPDKEGHYDFIDMAVNSNISFYAVDGGDQAYIPRQTEHNLGFINLNEIEDYVKIDDVNKKVSGFIGADLRKIVSIGSDGYYGLGEFSYLKGGKKTIVLYCTYFEMNGKFVEYKWTRIIESLDGKTMGIKDLGGNSHAAFAVFTSDNKDLIFRSDSLPKNFSFQNLAIDNPNSFIVKFDNINGRGTPLMMLSSVPTASSPVGFEKISISKTPNDLTFWIAGQFSYNTKIKRHLPLLQPETVATINPINEPNANNEWIFIAKGNKNTFGIAHQEQFDDFSDGKSSYVSGIAHINETLYLQGSGYPGMPFGGTGSPIKIEADNSSAFLAKRNTKELPDPTSPFNAEPGITKTKLESQSNFVLSVLNPTTADNITFTVNADADDILNVSLLDVTGTVVYKEQYRVVAGNNSLALNAPKLNAGFYVLRVVGTNFESSSTVVKQ